MRLLFIILVTCLVFTTTKTNAQEQPVLQKLSLERAQSIALQNNPELQVKTINTAIAQKKIEQAKWEKIPDIYANIDLRRNLIIPTTPVPAKAFNPDAEKGEIMPLQFMTDWSSQAGINASFDLFNPKIHGQIKEAKQQAQIKSITQKISANQLKYQVGADYAALIIAKKQFQLAIADTINKTKILAMVQEQHQAGRLTISELNNTRSNKNQSISRYFKASKILISAKAQLLTDLGISPKEKERLSISDDINSLLYTNNKNLQKNSLSLTKRKQERRLTKVQLHNTKLEFLPTVSLEGFYGSNFYNNDFDIFKDQNWYGNSYVGLSINIPITQGLDRIKKINQLQLQKQVDKANYKAQKNQLQLEKLQAQQDIVYKKKVLQQKKKNMALIQKNLLSAKDKFSSGRLLISELLKNDFLYQKAKTNYLQAAYDYILAKMQLKKVRRK